MKIVERTQDRLVLHYRDRFSFFFFLAFLSIWVSGLLLVLIHAPDEVATIATAIAVICISLVVFWYMWCDVTATFDRKSNQITVVWQRLHWTRRAHRALLDVGQITCDIDLDSDTATISVSFHSNGRSLFLPARQHLLFHPYNSYVEALVADLRAWIGPAPCNTSMEIR